ncbi:MAG: hypothetical protein GQ574_14145 [Crocinitomix sp.]|nr:hypothetical protein [Crocinitomix sp.]
MGIFDFFKKKENTQKSNEPVKKNLAKEDGRNVKPNSLSELKSIGAKKSLNDLYAEKLQNKPAEEPNPNKIEVVLDDTGTHQENFGGLFGFNYANSKKGNKFLYEMVALSAIQPPFYENPVYSVAEVGFGEASGGSELVKIRSIKHNDQILSAFPYLKTTYTLPFETKQIIEWSHIAKLEAEIKGGGRDTFGLAFFATDYGINRNKYKSIKKLNINISAIAMVLDKSDLTEINGTPLSPDFATYMPSKDILRPTYYDFIGVLNNFQECNLSKDSLGYILNVKLINQENEPDFFTVDMFVNRENMRITDLKKGMKVAGALWFQGEIAKDS